MHKQEHWSLASHLIGDSSWRMYGYALKLGSIMPDILVHTYILGHKYTTTAERVEQNLQDLKENGSWTLYDCFRLGYNLHYVEDYFTHPHNTNFEGGFIDHCRYEFRLKKAMREYLAAGERPAPIALSKSDCVMAVLDEQHAQYMEAEPSPENDAHNIVCAAEAISNEVFAAFTKQSSTTRSLAFMARAGMVGYSPAADSI